MKQITVGDIRNVIKDLDDNTEVWVGYEGTAGPALAIIVEEDTLVIDTP